MKDTLLIILPKNPGINIRASHLIKFKKHYAIPGQKFLTLAGLVVFKPDSLKVFGPYRPALSSDTTGAKRWGPHFTKRRDFKKERSQR